MKDRKKLGISQPGENKRFNNEIPQEIKQKLIEMVTPSEGKFSCFIIGNSNLPIKCAEIILRYGHKIYGMLSHDHRVEEFANKKGIPFISARKSLVVPLLKIKPFHYFFSISNEMILTKEMLNQPIKGTINYHNALLPGYAGTNATNWAVLNMEKTHGITWHFVDEGIDTGDIIKQVKIDISPQETGISLNIKCSEACIDAFEEIIRGLDDGQKDEFPRRKQEETKENRYSYFGKYKRPDKGGLISFFWDAHKISAFTRGLNFELYENPIGTPKISIGNDFFILPQVSVLDTDSQIPPGTIVKIKPGSLIISTASKDIEIKKTLTVNGDELSIQDFVKQYHLHDGYCFVEEDKDTAKRIEELDNNVAKNESFWARRLNRMQPIDFTNTIFKDLPDKKGTVNRKRFTLPGEIKNIDNIVPREEFLLYVFAAFLSRVSNISEFHMGYTDSSILANVNGLDRVFADQVPFHVEWDPQESFKTFCKKMQKELKKVKKRNTYLRDIRVRYPVLHSTHVQSLSVGAALVKDINEIDLSLFKPLNLVISPQEDECVLFYSCSPESAGDDEDGESAAQLFKEKIIDRFIKYFRKMVSSINRYIERNMSEIEIMPEEEKNIVLYEFNAKKSLYPKDKTIHELFEEQVVRTPGNIAVNGLTYGDRGMDLTYRELNGKANQLARLLRPKGIKPDNIAAIMVEPSQEMIIGLLGILKAGGAFLPIKDGTPSERVNYILSESGALLLLTRSELVEGVIFAGEIVSLDDANIYRGEVENLRLVNKPGDLAYVIYTSGSTGKPKGVMLEHGNLINLCFWHNKYYSVTADDRATKYAGFGFDASVWEVFPYLLIGAALYIVPEEIKLDVEALNKYFQDNGVTISFLPTQVCEQFMNVENTSLKTLLTGGDKLKTFIKKDYRFFNNYGPTENTVVTTSFHVTKTTSNIPIGKPLYNNQIYIVDKYYNIQPIGITGELLIGGDSVARGYVNKPKLTGEKFIQLEWLSDLPFPEKIFKTGDLSRWLPDGNIEFMGRIDFQVKIRGYRIELAEIENQLLKLEEIKETVVIAREETSGEKYLCAYIVSDKKVDEVTVRITLAKNLPEYMIPSAFVQVERFPLTPNGKIDTRALPVPETKSVEEYVAPENESEELLANIWSEVLVKEKIGVNDDFFTMGGDSIKAIRIISKLQKHWFKLEISQLFLYKNIRLVAKHLKSIDAERIRLAEQGIVEGEVILIPIQKWFFDQHLPYGHYFNHTVKLYRKKGFEEAIIEKVFTRIVEHHDALRMIFKIEKGTQKISQVNRGIDGKLFDLQVIHLVIDKDEAAEIKLESMRIQKGIDLQKGPLVKLGLFKGAQGDHLLVAIHHSVVDGISWRILLEDFETGYQQAAEGKDISFQDKTDSFQHWAKKLVEYSQTSHLLRELHFWRAIEETAVEVLPVDHEIRKEDRKFKHADIAPMVLTREKTAKLLTKVNLPYNTEINDILLTALGLAVKQWAGIEKVLINMEGHGREEVIEDADVSRTVGWFTIQYPLILDMEKTGNLSYTIRNVKETLRRIPNKGIGHGILKYLSPDRKKKSTRFIHKPEIVFNYLGAFGEESFKIIDSITGITNLDIEDAINPDFELDHKIDIEGVIDGKCLKLLFFYNQLEYERETMEKLAEILQVHLEAVIDHCAAKEEIQLTPSDLGYYKISIEDLEKITNHLKMNIGEDIEIQLMYSLSPMQGGLFYHWLMDRESSAYFEQVVLKLQGEIEKSLMEDSFNQLIDRHDVLRTIFSYEGLEEPLQIVLKERRISLSYEDITHLNENQQEKYIKEFLKKDQERGFDLMMGPLTRFSMIKTRRNIHRFIWSFHHIIMDGWCIPIIREELMKIYRTLKKGESLELEPVTPYVEYINWLENQDKEQGLLYWKKYLEAYEESARVPKLDRRVMEEDYKHEEYHITIKGEFMRDLEKMASQSQVTVNTVVQTVWGVLLQRNNNRYDVVYGTIVSGRSSEIERIERLVGLFINMIPVRIMSTVEEEFSQLLKDVQDSSIASRKYEYLPAVEIQAKSALKGDLIDHLLIFENYPVPDTSPEQEKIYIEEGIEVYEHTHYNFNIIVIPGERLHINFIYNELVYDRALIENIAGHFENVLGQVVENPDIVIREIEIITEKERNEILYDFNDTAVEYSWDKTIHELFEARVEKSRDSIAVIGTAHSVQRTAQDREPDKKCQAASMMRPALTYRELNEKSNQLARILKEKGVKPDHIVGLMAHPSMEFIVGVMAILKAGGIYLPIEPVHPKNHISQQLEECKTRLLLSAGIPFKTNDFDIEVMDLEGPSLYRGETKNLEVLNSPHDLAYIVYASHSPVEPTVMMMEHASIINTLVLFQKKYPVGGKDVYLLKTPLQFNVSMPELLGWFLGGGSLSIPGQGEENDIGIILNRIESEKITHIYFAPTWFNQMVNVLLTDHGNITKISTLKYVFLSGEIIVPESINRFSRLKPGLEIVNLYRPNDIPVYAAAYSLSQWSGSGSIPIGTPMDNMKVYILTFIDGKGKEARAELVPVGVPGELCISGPCLARENLKRPGFTGKNFPDNPFAEEGGLSRWFKKVYRTGDLARWLPGGNIEYLGRMDQQVKIRGTRIEIERIEDQLLKQEKVKEAIVVARTDNKGEIYLCAYIVSDEMLDTSMLRDTLAKYLPAIMIPTYIVPMERIPLTPDNKADRNELLGPQHDPRLIEERLVEIEAGALHISKEEIDLDYSFLELVGHPYTPAQLISMIQRAFHVKISMAELFRRPTLRQLSEYLTEIISEKYELIQPVEAREYYPQSSAQKRLYFLQQMEKGSTVYNIWMMDIYQKGIEKEYLEEAFKKLLRRHESLRTSFHALDGAALQKINDYREVVSNFEIKYYETTEEGLIYSCEAGNRGDIVGEHFTGVIKGFVKPFDLSRAPLLRVGFIKVGEYSEILMLDIHLIISDFISLKILEKELWGLYDKKELPPLRLRYKDFSQWLNSEDRVEAGKELESFWLKEFSGEIPLIKLPVDSQRPAMPCFEGDTLEFEIGKEETRQLKEIAKEHGETLYIVLLSLYNVLLAKLSGQEDIVVGIITADRVHEDLRDIVGMFANTLALRNYPEGEKIFDDFLVDVRINTFAALENQDYPFEQLVSRVASRQEINRNPLFDAAFELEYETDPTGYLLEAIKTVEPKPYDFGNRNSKFDMTLVCVVVEDGLECAIEYSAKLFKKETIERFVKYFKKIVSSVCGNIHWKIGEIEIISEEEKTQILYEFNDTRVEYHRDKTIHELFENRVEKTPGNIAIKNRDDSLTYLEVNERANQLARVLREKGVKPDCIVGIMVGRSMEMIIGIMAILKAGGAYLPVDPNYPKDRIGYLLKDSAGKLLLTQGKFFDFAKIVDFDGQVINLEDESLYCSENQNLELENGPGDLAYIIYTSGSTGKPKAVTIEHVSAVNLLKTLDRMYPLEKSDAYLLKTAFLFDVSVSEIFGWFWRGGRLVILEPGGEREPLKIIDKIEEEKITHVNFVPSLFNIFVGILDRENIGKLSGLRYIFLAGEAIWPDSITKFREPNSKVIVENLYGPTEATVYASWYPVAKWEGIGSISIGKPIDNLKLFILSSDDKARPGLQPAGIAGELTISGIGLARGYLNHPRLTAEKFVDNPFAGAGQGDETFKKLYHTGDLARWYYDGNIEYMGRIDHQVKIRGFRIELGEIESQLLNIENIKEAVALAKEDNKGEKYLCSYFVASKTLDVSSIRSTLSKSMPDYMVPSYFVQIETIPLTPTGKLDRKALPEPEAKGMAEYAAPTNEIEEILTGTWSNVLGNERIGINDNFFEIGGDSIKAIQIASKLQKHKLKMEVNQVFLHRTVRELAKYLKPLDEGKTGLSEQGVVKGKVELTPIQKWLFTGNFSYCHHFNQSVTLYRKAGFNETYIEKVFTKIPEHHDALRMKYKFEHDPNTVVQEIQGIKGKFFDLEVIPIDNEKNEPAAIKLKAESFRIHGSIDLQTSPLVKLGLFKGTAGDRLLIVIHHLVVDGICWRILLEDFETGYQQAAQYKEITFREKTGSYKLWSQKLKEYAESKILLKELPYWQEVEETEVKHLPVDYVINREERKFKFYDMVSMILPEQKTRQLLTKVNRAYNTEINDIFLAALGLAIKQWTGMDIVGINLEGHGREMIIENMDITRTVGWFTTQYPVILDTEKSDDLSFYIRNVKEILRAIPNKGIGYGILKYLTPLQKRESLGFKFAPEILFNYLGKFGGESFKVIDEITGITDLNIEACSHPDMEMEPKIDIEGVIDGEKLKMSVIYNKKEYKRETIEKFAEILKINLEKVIDHCRLKEETVYTPSDFGYKNLSIEDLARITYYIKTKISPGMEIQSIYPLSPMQSGLYFHWLKDEGVNAYCDQMLLTLEGEIEKSLLEESLNHLVDRYDVFRTIISYEGLVAPVQIVLKKRKPKLFYENISHLNRDDRLKYIKKLRRRDRDRGFDLTRDQLTRFFLVKTGKNEYRLVWSFHHIIMDGWCIPIIKEELRKIYRALKKGEPLELEPVTPYIEYINWLENRDNEEGLCYWDKYLEDYEEPAGLPKLDCRVKEEDYKHEEYHLTIKGELMRDLERMAGKSQVTINTVVQTVWGILLQRYNNRDDVVYGIIVSGRSSEIEGVERIVGLFINMIPLRIKSKGAKEFSQLLKEVQENSIASRKYEYLGAAEIQARSTLKGDLVDHLLVFENYPVLDTDTEPDQGYIEKGIEYYEQTHYNFNIIVIPWEHLLVNFSYNVLVFDSILIENIAGHFENVLSQVVDNPGIAIQEIEIITGKERYKILFEFNDTESDYPKDKTVYELFENQVEKTPDNIALGQGNMHLTYDELNRASRQIVCELIEKGVKVDCIVGIMVERSIEMIIGVLGILKANGAYLPIDPDYPADRIKFMITDSSSNVLVTLRSLVERVERLKNWEGEVILLDEPPAAINRVSSPGIRPAHDNTFGSVARHRQRAAGPVNLAYVIYTSGSTGRPKGVVVVHRNVIRLVKNVNYIDFKSCDRILQTGALEFDASTFEIWGTLLNGLTLYLVDKETILAPGELKKSIADNQVTTMWLTSPLFNQVVQSDMEIFTGLRNLLVGGDVLSPTHINRVRYAFPGLNIINGYGPTENTTFSTTFLIDKDYKERIPIGKPIANSTAYIVDHYNNLQPIGVSGELWVGGDGVSRGYLNNPELTFERFINYKLQITNYHVQNYNPNGIHASSYPCSHVSMQYHSYSPHLPHSSIYKTGDLARWLPDGNIEFLGRIDHQVKIRGFRIEPGEIENHLLNHNHIKEVVVLVKTDKIGDKYLCAYIVSGLSPQNFHDLDLKTFLSACLPDYMIPSYFVLLEKIPLTPNGKVDRRKLPDPQIKARGNSYAAPRNEIEDKLAGVWSQLLHIKKDLIGIDDDFFKLGGHSLKAAVMITMIHKVLNVKVKMHEIFNMSTIRKLAGFITEAKEHVYLSIPLAEEKEYYPQTSPQKRLFFMDQLENAGIVYNMQLMDIYCKGIEKEALEEAVRKLIKRHESLRTSFFTLEGEAVQKVHNFAEVGADFAVEYYEMSEDEMISPGKQGKGYVRGKNIHFKDLKELTEHFVRPFDLTRPPLLRLGLIKIWGNTKILMLDTHHIVSDGVSLVVFLNDLWELYDGEELSTLNIQYKDFAQWTHHDDRKAAVKKQEKYWLSVFDGEIAVLNLPYDKPRPSRVTFNGDMLHFDVGKECMQKLNLLAREQGVTLYMILFAACNVLLAKLSGQEEIIVGTVTAGRDHADLQKLIGMFVNTLALRSFPEGNQTFKEFLGEVRENILAAFENQDYPFEELVGKVSSRGDVSRNPVFDVVFGLDNEAERTDLYLLEALMVDKSNPFRTRKAKFDISLIGAETGDELHFNLEYNINLFKQETIERFIKNFKTILTSITGDICKQLSQVDIIPHDERAMILYMFNDTEAEYPKDKTVHELFEKQAAKGINNIAVVGHDLETGREVSLSYKELNKRVNQLGRLLRDKGLKPDHLAAIMLGPSVQMIVGMLAVLKAGGGFLPIDHKIPGDRVKYMLQDSGVRFFLSRVQLVKEIDYNGEIIQMDDAGTYSGDPGNLELVNKPADLAYVIYTSGSTGKPKGVLGEHRPLINLCYWYNRYFSITPRDRATKYASFGFDASVWEIFPHLLMGSSLYIVPEEIKLDINALNRYFEDNSITVSFLPTQMGEQFMSINNRSLRVLQAAGDKLKSFVKKHYQLYNCYGPTENTVCATAYLVTVFNRNIPIGAPIYNNQVYILDKNDHLLPIGVPGELCVGGDSVARGYMNNQRLTYEKFIDNPYPLPIPLMQSPRLYRTGDLARWLHDGNIEFLGRIDYQVKVRGYRIELGEIENQLMHVEDIDDVVVLAREDSLGQKYLCAYLVADKTIDIPPVKKKLSKSLPEYMIPAYFMQLEQIPLNPNGKIDRERLPEPELRGAAEFAAPGNETEKVLAEIWSEVLGIEKVSIDDNFFEIGGDSIKSILISGRLLKRQLSINVNDFFANPTIRQAAAYVQKIQRKIHQGLVEGVVELTPIQKWFFEKDFKEKHYFNHVVWLYTAKRFNKKIVKKVFAKIMEHHDALRMAYDIHDNQVVQENRGLKQGKLFDLKVIDFRSKKDADFDDYSKRINRSIHLKTGPLVKIGLFRTTTGDHLLLVIHHLVVDGVSWRVLLDDFETGYEQAEKGEAIKFQHKTDSFKYWAYQLKQNADSPEALKELDYWKKIEETKLEMLPKDHQVGKKKKIFKNREVVMMHLDRKDTKKLLKEVNAAYNTEINDILLTALGMALNQCKGMEKVLIHLEGHGRETIIEDMDTSRTVGWFTSQYPLLLDMKQLSRQPLPGEEQLGAQIQRVKETLRRVPNKGIGYGILKYLTSPEKKKGVTFKLQPEISFNYHGKLEAERYGYNKRFQVNFGDSFSSKFDMDYAIDMIGVVDTAGLKFSVAYNKYEYERATIKNFVESYKSTLLKIIDHCVEKKKHILALGMTATDYHIKRDCEIYLQQVNREQWPDFTKENDYRHILLTGATGFMGAFLVAELLDKTNAALYLPVRGAAQKESEERFQKKMAFYFGKRFYPANKDRLVVVRSDLSQDRLGLDDPQYETLCKTAAAIIHPAANVKHHGLYEELHRDNVTSTENLLELAVTGKKKDFHYISTLDVGSGKIPGKECSVFTESCHDEGQEIDHIYLKSKFTAEQRVLAYRKKGLNGSIYRVGNLIFHSDTGKFQENIEDDYFYAIIRGVVKLGMVSGNMNKIVFDMSFIDYIARATVLLLTRAQLKNETYHLCNPHKLPMPEMAGFLKEIGIALTDLKQEDVQDYLSRFAGNSEYEKIIERLRLHTEMFEKDIGTRTVYKIDRTVKLLKTLGLQWPKVTKKHIERMIAYCKRVGFL